MAVENGEQESLIPERVGDQLRAARTKAGMDLSDIAARTRVPLRHLTAIEAGDYQSLPSSTYSVGFVKAYARAVGLDGAVLAKDLREELGTVTPLERAQPVDLDHDESGPVPSSKLAWTAGALLLIVAGGYGVIRATQQDSSSTPTEVVADRPADADETANSAAPAVPSNPTGVVVLKAKDKVWLRIYDAADKVLFEKEMALGEAYQVPADANSPMIRTGRPDLLSVSIDGKEVEPLGPPERTIKDVGVSAKALTDRTAPAAAAGASSAPGTATAVTATVPATNAAQSLNQN